MPAPKLEQNMTETRGLKVIDYSRMMIRVVYPKDNNATIWQMGDATPSRPPWTTWTGILEARLDSPVGKRILAMDPNAINGSKASEEDLKKMHKRSDEAKKEWVRGIWTAPEDWKGIEV